MKHINNFKLVFIPNNIRKKSIDNQINITQIKIKIMCNVN